MRFTWVPLLFWLPILGCSEMAYDPNWDPYGPIADGKADGLFDIAPRLEIGVPVEGDVGGDRMELYRIELRRTDHIELEMRVIEGDLNPHLTVLYGPYVHVYSESSSSDGSVLVKEYLLEEAGDYFVAARAYREEGSGRYVLTARCLGGPCAGEFPPGSDLTATEVADCVSQARHCAFERLDRYHGAVGPVRAHGLFDECLHEASRADGSSCEAACAWQGSFEDSTGDDALGLCESITESLIFYADQTAACLDLLAYCMDECYGANNWDGGGGDEIYETSEAQCWQDGFNGNCDSYTRRHETCGGTVLVGSAAECTVWCNSTVGAQIEDVDERCGSEASCDEHCDVDVAQAGDICGGLTSANEACLLGVLEDNDAGICEATLRDAIDG